MRTLALSGHLAAKTKEGDPVLIIGFDIGGDEDDFALCIRADGGLQWHPMSTLTTGWRFDAEAGVWTSEVATETELAEWEASQDPGPLPTQLQGEGGENAP